MKTKQINPKAQINILERSKFAIQADYWKDWSFFGIIKYLIVEIQNEENSFMAKFLTLFLLFVTISTFPLLMFYYLFLQFHKTENRLIGVFRLVSMGFIICGPYKFNIMYFIQTFLPTLLPEWSILPVSLILMLGITYTVITSLFIIIGVYEGKVFHDTSHNASSRYSGINRALDFREGVIMQQGNRGAMEELGKTAYMTDNMFDELSNQSESYKRAVEYLDTKMDMASNREAYEMLKESISGKK